MEGLVDEARLQSAVEAWTEEPSDIRPDAASASTHTAPGVAVRLLMDLAETVKALLDGNAVLISGDEMWGTAWNISKQAGRDVDKPENEPTLQGPQEAFVENLQQNLALLRKRCRTSDFKVETIHVGVRAPVLVALIYMNEVTPFSLVNEVRQRIEQIQVDAPVDANVIREFITDAPFTLFPMIEQTERPERVVSSLLQGRMGVMMDGAPNCMVMPATFTMFLSSPEDYYTHFALALPLRLLRHVMFWAAVLVPSMYVALLTHNQDLIPMPLLVSVAAQHAGIPFPTSMEALGMMVAFEALREAGTRLPRAVGQSVSIVGTLVIGDAAVRAGLVSAGMVIVVASTGVASFTLPALGLVQAARLLQFPFVIVASVSGLYGVILLGVVLLGHMSSLESFGVPYLSPVAPTVRNDLKDALIRAPWWAMTRRPLQFHATDSVRADRARAAQRRGR